MVWSVRAVNFIFWMPLVALSSCGTMTKKELGEWRTAPMVELNGAKVRSEVELLRGKHAVQLDTIVFRAQTAELDGPFHWKICVEGTAGLHQSMQLHAMQITTQRTLRTASYPVSMLGGVNPFIPVSEKKGEPRSVASYTLPGELQLFPKADGKIMVSADLSVISTKGSQREWITFTLLPNPNKSGSFIFAPTTVDYHGVPADWGNTPTIDPAMQDTSETIPPSEGSPMLEPLPEH